MVELERKRERCDGERMELTKGTTSEKEGRPVGHNPVTSHTLFPSTTVSSVPYRTFFRPFSDRRPRFV